MKRREFLKTSLAVSAVAVASAGCTATPAQNPVRPKGASRKQEYYELRAYRLKAGSTGGVLQAYLQQALVPALNRLGIEPVGVFAETEPKDPATLFVLIPYPSLETFQSIASRLESDSEYLSLAADYLHTGKDHPAYDRIDTWVLRAFAGMPRIELPPYSRLRKERLFEMRTYESYSETKAAKKVAMFNHGEIDIMREVGLAPIFYGEALAGPNLPHLTYMTSGENAQAHQQHWEAFRKHPKWEQMKDDPQYADTVSKITKWFLVPTGYSQI